MTEQQKYTVERELDGFELRRYAPHVLAVVTVSTSFDSAGSAGFRPLVSYIGGRNTGSQKIAMTAPVLQEPAPDDRGHEVSFVMPAGADLESMPAPADGQVRMRAVDAELVAAARFSGRWSEKSFLQHSEQLLARVRAAGLTPTGPVRLARYDPPWTPWFMRRNEVLVPVAES